MVGVHFALALSLSGTLAAAQLAGKRFNYTSLPYQADTSTGDRGRQTGYNQCNSTTEGPTSLCQTATIVDVADFCLWAPTEPNSVVGDVEGSMVAWCTKPGRGTRLIPEGVLKGVQFTKTPHYLQVVGFIDQSLLNIQAGDTGGEMDPHGADQRGNPLGGLLFTPSFGASVVNSSAAAIPASRFQQVVQWHNFVGSNTFCLKACDPSYGRDYALCEHIYDRIGCSYNAPADYPAINGTFQSCQGEDQLPPGVYVGSNGATSTYTQPPESLGAITSIPYTAAIPSSSNCVFYESSAIYQNAAVVTTSAPVSSATSPATTTSSATSSVTSSATSSATTSANSASTRTTSEVSSATSTQPTATGTGANAAASTAPASGAAGLSVGAGAGSGLAVALALGALALVG